MRIDEKRPPGCWKVRTIISSLRTAIRTGTRWAALLRSAAGCKNVANARAWNARMRSPQNLATFGGRWSKRRLPPAFLWL